MSLTDTAFWDGYWHGCRLPIRINQSFSFERCLAVALKPHLTAQQGEILEIGCAPGKWLVMAAEECGLKPSGIDYSPVGVAATTKNFELLGIDFGFVCLGDFMTLAPSCQFNVVMSLGFIEHFDHVEDIVARHLEWLQPGGVLILGIPNFKGIYGVLQHILDRSILDKHNRRIMEMSFFQQLAKKFALSIQFLDYIGSFEPDLPIARTGIRNPQQFLVKSVLKMARQIRRISFWDQINHPMFSSYILAVFRR